MSDINDVNFAFKQGAQVQTDDIADLSVTTAKIAAANVTLAKLATGIAPAFIVVAAGQHTSVGGDTAESAASASVVASDIAIACLEDNGTNNVTLVQTAAAAAAVNFTMSADPGNDAIINYMVLRAAS